MINNILEIEHKENGISVTIFSAKKVIAPIQEKVIEQAILPETKSLETKVQKPSIIKEWLLDTKEQILGSKPKNTKVYVPLAVQEKLSEYALTKEKVIDAVLHGKYVQGKKDRISRKYNGYEIGTITKYSSATKTYVVLSAWRKDTK